MERMNQSRKVPIHDAAEESSAEAHETQEAGNMEEQAREAEIQQEMAEEAVEQAQDAEEAQEEEAADYKDLYLRTLAEFENYRRRADRETNEFKKYANETLIKDIIPVIDNLERAMECTVNTDDPGCAQNLLAGVQMTEREILKVLEKYGVTRISAIGETFDPAYHQALMAEESDEHPDETVIREMQKGYLLKDRLIRPALVAVAKGKA
ncbi:nucleotide exchange factor GrpE [Desulfatibacillum aliphaticivorans]|uniref:Protein GrpE n=1 Tax=Desulfatibacillum aliphaticivorans TaxID=218208 RepID=GRPE_DESAL|nr:nucleotide exchange factor GrpE [Desulfatibacillum aliphaticivorans]B8FGS4.1 RecName: Full=Protein GrpE; AltName: Full=HSP-70 cofactor [Desulfatibacillum aliphaticivorans]ACL05304.1 GrpE protein [Desulfatibacillum aliphaticivorans]